MTKQTMRKIDVPDPIVLSARLCPSCGTAVNLPGLSAEQSEALRRYSLTDYLAEALNAHRENGSTKAARKRHAAVAKKLRAHTGPTLLLTEDEWGLVKASTDAMACHPAVGQLVADYDEAVDGATRVEVDLQIVRGPEPVREGGAA